MKNKRREFLSNVCPSVALAFMGVTMLEACSSGGDDAIDNGNDGSGGDGNTDRGYVISGSDIIIDLNHGNFSALSTNGWMNFTAQKMLLLKIDASNYRAFTNSCPHQGQRNSWSYNSSEDKFKCSAHSHSYPSDCNTDGSVGGKLKCFETSYASDKLTVTPS
jgi:nitrite reductase/ring-hydroxylating ferredoxin subunit